MVLKDYEENALSSIIGTLIQNQVTKHLNDLLCLVMKYEKLKRGWQFGKVYKEGYKYFDDLFVLYILSNNTPEVRIGLTVTKKIGKSVQRNRVKRVIREVFRLSKGILPGNDIVVVARKPAVNLKYSQVQNSLNQLLRRARILEK